MREVILKPGGPGYDPERIVATKTTKSVQIARGGAFEPAGTAADEVDRIDAYGMRVIRHGLLVDSPTLGRYDLRIAVDESTLAPIALEARFPGLDVSAKYRRGRVTGARKQKGHIQIAGGLKIPRDVFDLWSLDLVLRSVELEEGWAATLNVVDPISARVARARLEVSGSETIDDRRCWHVTSSLDDETTDFWIGDGGSVVRQWFSIAPGQVMQIG